MNKYETYKDSQIPWLGEVPEHWEVKRLRFAINLNPVKSELNLSSDTLVSFIPMEAVNLDKDLTLTQEKNLDEVYKGYTYFRNGDVVIAKITPCFENGKSAIAQNLTNEIAFGTTELHVLRASQVINNQYLYYLIKSNLFMKLGEAEMYGAGGQKRVPEEFIKNFFIGIPPLPEQTAIAHYLDTKLGEIDALIGKQQTLLEKLTEQRTALITQAVTKGLNPNAPMKNSGVEWLGEVPAHWIAMPVKFSLSMPITDGPHETPEILSEGIPFISAEAVKNDKLDFNKKRGYISEEDNARFSKKYSPLKGDIYMVKSGATTGNVAKVETDEVFNIWSPLAVMRPNRNIISTAFLFYAIKSDYFNTSVQLKWNMGTQQNIGMGVLSNIRIFVPPTEEQTAIAAHLDKETVKIDRLCNKVNQAIERLKEYRTALITQAVTGKIKVV